MTITPTLFLRRALLADAVASAGTGVLMAFGAGFLTNVLGLPEMLLREAGIFLLPYAAFVGWMGTRARLPEGLVWLVIVGNALWTVASIASSSGPSRRHSDTPSSWGRRWWSESSPSFSTWVSSGHSRRRPEPTA